jgi:hypothetical protein
MTIIAIILAVMMITALVGCGKGKREVVQLTLSTEDAEAILRAAGIVLPDPETAARANSVVQCFRLKPLDKIQPPWYNS